MAVIDQHLRRAAIEGTGDRGIRLFRHQAAGVLVFKITRLALLRDHDARNALNVH